MCVCLRCDGDDNAWWSYSCCRTNYVQIQGPKTDENYFRHEDEVIHMEDEMVGAMQEFRIQAVEHNKEFLRKVVSTRLLSCVYTGCAICIMDSWTRLLHVFG